MIRKVQLREREREKLTKPAPPTPSHVHKEETIGIFIKRAYQNPGGATEEKILS